MVGNGNKRLSSDYDEFEPTKLDKKKAKKLLVKQHPKPQVFKGRQPDPYFSETEGDIESEGKMEAVSDKDFDNSPFLIDITNDMKKFRPSEAHVLVALQRFYSKLEIRISKSWKGQSLIHPLSNDAMFILTNLSSLDSKPISFMQIDARLFLLTAILCKVPHAFTEDLIKEIVPQVAKAIRLTCSSTTLQKTVPTMLKEKEEKERKLREKERKLREKKERKVREKKERKEKKTEEQTKSKEPAPRVHQTWPLSLSHSESSPSDPTKRSINGIKSLVITTRNKFRKSNVHLICMTSRRQFLITATPELDL